MFFILFAVFPFVLFYILFGMSVLLVIIFVSSPQENENRTGTVKWVRDRLIEIVLFLFIFIGPALLLALIGMFGGGGGFDCNSSLYRC